jgi:hypothetical protein
LVVDEAGTCSDMCILPVLPYTDDDHTFTRLVVVGDARITR